MYHAILMQSSYPDNTKSDRRLELSLKTSIPSLLSQSLKPFLHIEVSRYDKNIKERINAFKSTGCELVVVYSDDPQMWHLPDARKIMHRMDDDDIVSSDFCERTRAAAIYEGDISLIWPNGFVLYNGKLYPKQHHNNQFVTLVTDRMWHPYQVNHHRFYNMNEWRNIIVSDEQAWIWVRHADSISKTRKVYLSSSPVDSLPEIFSVDYSEINRLVSSMGRCK